MEREHAKLLIPRRRIAVLQAITAIVAVVALGFSVFSFSTRLTDIQASRYRSSKDTCEVFRTIVYAATPPSRINRAHELLSRVGIETPQWKDNCSVFAHSKTDVKGR